MALPTEIIATVEERLEKYYGMLFFIKWEFYRGVEELITCLCEV